MAKHNKKRNVGLIHEQLVRHASEKMIQKDNKSAKVAFSILEKHFTKDSELYKEFRLFNSLVHTRIDSEKLAYKIIEESKQACKIHDQRKIRSEKSRLIKDINHNLTEDNFYGKKISNYKIFATVQSLINEWRGLGNLSPREIVLYEQYLMKWLTREKNNTNLTVTNKAANPLTLSIMTEKFNKKYNDRFSKAQFALLESKLLEDESRTVGLIENIKKDAMASVNNFYSSCENEFLVNKRPLIEARIKNLEIDTSDIVVEKALSLVKLIEELESEDE